MKKISLLLTAFIATFLLTSCGSNNSKETSSSDKVSSNMVKVPVYDMSKISADKEVSGDSYLSDYQTQQQAVSELQKLGFKTKTIEMSNAEVKEDAKGTSVDELTYIKGNTWLASSNPSVKQINGNNYAKKGSTLTLVIAKEDSNNESESSSGSVNKLGTLVTTDSGNEITVTAITENAQVELDDAKEGETALEVDLTVTNKGSDSEYFNPSTPSVYDSENNTLNLDSATYTNDIPDLAPGITAKIKLFYDNAGTGPYKFTYGNAVWSN